MFNLTHQLPSKFWVACSGGLDSMAAAHWLRRRRGFKGLLHVNHATGVYANSAQEFVESYAHSHGLECRTLVLGDTPPQGLSKEAWWREQRYSWFHSVDDTVVLAHHLDDCVEEYLMCSLVRGFHGTIPYAHANCVRPFRLWSRASIRDYAQYNQLEWVEDPSNADTRYKRNYIRHVLMPQALAVNPGLHKMVSRLILKGDLRGRND